MSEFTIDESAYASYILGASKSVKIKGKKEIVEATKNVLEASKKLYDALLNEDIEVQNVFPLLESKRLHAKKYNKVTGRIWRL